MKQSKLALKDLATFQQTFLPRTGESVNIRGLILFRKGEKIVSWCPEPSACIEMGKGLAGMLYNTENISTECIPETFLTYLAPGPSWSQALITVQEHSELKLCNNDSAVITRTGFSTSKICRAREISHWFCLVVPTDANHHFSYFSFLYHSRISWRSLKGKTCSPVSWRIQKVQVPVSLQRNMFCCSLSPYTCSETIFVFTYFPNTCAIHLDSFFFFPLHIIKYLLIYF